MTFRDYVIEKLRNDGDSTTKQIWQYLPPEGRAEMSPTVVHENMEEMQKDGLVQIIKRHWRLA